MNRIPLMLLVSCLLPIPRASAAQTLNDAEIAHIAVTANQLDITGAEQALEKSSNAAVRSFAATLIRDHEGVIEQAAALASRLGVTPQENETSASLARQASGVRERLAVMHGSDFDAAYMHNEVAYHEAVITAVESTLVPNTTNGELKQLLEAVVPALRAHLDHARRLSAELSAR